MVVTGTLDSGFVRCAVARHRDTQLGARLRRRWRAFVVWTSWTPPTSTEIALVAKASLAAALSWFLAVTLTDVPDPVLAPLAAVVTVQVSVRASVRTAIQRSAAVVIGVLLAVAVGDTLGLSTLSVGLLTAASLAIAQLLLRLPRSAASQVPVSVLVVLTAVTGRQGSYGWQRVFDTLLGAAVGVAVSLALPASRLSDARQTLSRLAATLGSVLDDMAAGLQETWHTEQTTEWRRRARVTRERLVGEAKEAVGNGRESARWNIRDRTHKAELGRYEEVLPRLERTAIGVSVISRGLDDHVHLTGVEHRAMPDMAQLLGALGQLVRALVRDVLREGSKQEVERALEDVRAKRVPCVRAAFRRAQQVYGDDESFPSPDGEWLNYAALLVQVDRIVDDLSAPLPP